MKAKDFRLFYLFFANMYGSIHSDDAYEIMKLFFPNLLKKEMYKDLNSRVNRFTRGYAIIKTTKNKYVIAREYYSFEELDQLFNAQSDKPFFVPVTLEEINYYTSRQFFFDENKEILEELNACLNPYLKKHKDSKMTFNRITWCLEILFESINMVRMEDIIELLNEFGIYFKTTDEMMTFALVYQKLNNNTRSIANRGYKPSDLSRYIDPNKIKLTIGPNMRESFLEKPDLAENYLNEVMSSNIPNIAKDSLISEITEIITETKNRKA